MNKKSKNKKDNRNVVEFPQQSKSKALDGARLREAYDAEEKDINISSKALNFNKIKPEDLNLYNFDYESIIPIINNLYNQLDELRFPMDKLNIINQIFEIIFNIIKYVKGDEYSDDDLSKICQYFLIKIKPEKIYSNLEFLEMFEDEIENNDNQINIQILKRSIENLLKTK